MVKTRSQATMADSGNAELPALLAEMKKSMEAEQEEIRIFKSLTFDGQTSWSVFKTQFDVVSSSNGWTDRVKASQLVASLRGSAAEVLQGIPAGNLTDLTTIERAMESRFGNSHLTQFYRTELKTRRQKPGESLQDAVTNSSVAATLVDLKKETIPVRILNMDNKPKTMDKGAIIATYEPVVDIVARLQEFSGEHPFHSILWTLLQKAKLKLSPKKCKFFRKEVSYLGHVISSEGVKADPEKIKAVVDWPRPETVHELRSFFGLCIYYHRFVRNFSTIARTLHKLMEAKSNFNWTENCKKSFNSLKQALTTSPVLTYPRTDEDFILDTDASNEGIGTVLSQKIGNEECVIAYFSKSLAILIVWLLRDVDRLSGRQGEKQEFDPRPWQLATKIGIANLQVKSSFVEKFPE
ncbi:retrovirus-related Pol polyprotein from transposon opus [Nephila pilipes]|uniref:RNA-directed DNA polymerase n=1 Tax=Nephila pilipes TaxID=299642 RepID=A0A8X6UFS0_NEPPI|nr:retrovirus-related Pol polyprotein from transposon opus [Nephila pilipes]